MANVVEITIKGIDKSSGPMGKVRASLGKIAKIGAVVGAVLATAFTVAIKSIINVGSKVENLKIRLNALLGSVQMGSKAFKEMAKFAATVPFSFDAIMESATTLAGVVTGGVDEISQMMPIIADLATVSGLSIQETTGQVQRMLSAGAGAADLFRERGITAMLGFQAGVAVSAKETKERLIDAFESPSSKFRDASKKMATTWDGVLSMIGDKWFTFKTNIADAGIFNFIKALAIAFDKMLGGALKSSGDTAKSFSDFMIGMLRNLISAVGVLVDVFRGLQVVWKGLEIAFAKFAELTIEMVFTIVDGWRQLANLIPGIDLGKLDTMGTVLGEARSRTAELNEEFTELLGKEMPSEKINEYRGLVEQTFTELQDLSNATMESIQAPMEALTEFQVAWNEEQTSFMSNLKENYSTFAASFFDLMNSTIDAISDSMAKTIVEGGNMAKAFQQIGKMVLTQLIAMLIKMGIQRLLVTAITKSAVATEGSAEGAKAVGLATANGIASWAAAPWPINLGAPAFGAAMGSAAATGLSAGIAAGGAIGATAGAAHGGLTNVPNESTFLLQKGERVLSPNQNSDLTSFMKGEGEGGGNSITIENVNVHVMENATSGDSILNMDKTELRENVAMPIIEALDDLYDHGVAPKFVEEGRT